jgi:hypothetical protein
MGMALPSSMPTSPSTHTVNLAGREIGCSCHACAFFRTDDQFYNVMLPFIREGFAAGAYDGIRSTPTRRHRPWS